MGFNSYTIASLVHITSMFLFQDTGAIEYLFVSLVLIAWSTIMFVLGVAFLISPEHEVEITDEMYETMSDYGSRAALQLTVLLIAYILYMSGYEFISAIVGFQAIVVLLSCTVSASKKRIVKK